ADLEQVARNALALLDLVHRPEQRRIYRKEPAFHAGRCTQVIPHLGLIHLPTMSSQPCPKNHVGRRTVPTTIPHISFRAHPFTCGSPANRAVVQPISGASRGDPAATIVP